MHSMGLLIQIIHNCWFEYKRVAMSNNSSLGVALKRCSNEANSSQEVAVLVYSAMTDSSYLK